MFIKRFVIAFVASVGLFIAALAPASALSINIDVDKEISEMSDEELLEAREGIKEGLVEIKEARVEVKEEVAEEHEGWIVDLVLSVTDGALDGAEEALIEVLAEIEAEIKARNL